MVSRRKTAIAARVVVLSEVFIIIVTGLEGEDRGICVSEVDKGKC